MLPRRLYSSTQQAPPKPPSPHGQFYSELVPGMLPIALLGSAVYMALKLVQTNLSQERYLDEAREKIGRLEEELEGLKVQVVPPKADAPLPPQTSSSKRGWLW